MAMVVQGGMCVQSITASRPYILRSATYRLLCWKRCLRLFVVGGERIVMAMVVVGHRGAHLYTKYHGHTQHYLLVIG